MSLSVSGSAGLTRLTSLSFREIGTPGSLPGHPKVLSPGFCPLSSVTMTALGTQSPQMETALRGQDQWDWTHLEIVTTSSHWDHTASHRRLWGHYEDTEGTLRGQSLEHHSIEKRLSAIRECPKEATRMLKEGMPCGWFRTLGLFILQGTPRSAHSNLQHPPEGEQGASTDLCSVVTVTGPEGPAESWVGRG